MTCPLCGKRHKAGTDYCPVLLTAIPVSKPLDTPSEQERTNEAGHDKTDNRNFATCPNCGYTGIAGEECDQCGQTILIGDRVLALMPDGSSILLPTSEETVIGRESHNEKVANSLSHCDGVSRRHCTLRFDPQGTCVTVIDLGSTNGTWIGDDGEPLMPNEMFTGRLPLEIHLGNRAVVVLRAE
ncbi:FHA domain [Slackia heliotrinireducens]|nr:FHA domain [Slackia heliotrinireducens]